MYRPLKDPGRPLTTAEAAKILGVDASTIRRHYKKWGGVWVSPRCLRFFENILNEKIRYHADQEGEYEQVRTEADTVEKGGTGDDESFDRYTDDPFGFLQIESEDDYCP